MSLKTLFFTLALGATTIVASSSLRTNAAGQSYKLVTSGKGCAAAGFIAITDPTECKNANGAVAGKVSVLYPHKALNQHRHDAPHGCFRNCWGNAKCDTRKFTRLDLNKQSTGLTYGCGGYFGCLCATKTQAKIQAEEQAEAAAIQKVIAEQKQLAAQKAAEAEREIAEQKQLAAQKAAEAERERKEQAEEAERKHQAEQAEQAERDAIAADKEQASALLIKHPLKSAAECGGIADKLDMSQGSARWPFEGNYATKGCYGYVTGKYANTAFFGTNPNGKEATWGTHAVEGGKVPL